MTPSRLASMASKVRPTSWPGGGMAATLSTPDPTPAPITGQRIPVVYHRSTAIKDMDDSQPLQQRQTTRWFFAPSTQLREQVCAVVEAVVTSDFFNSKDVTHTPKLLFQIGEGVATVLLAQLLPNMLRFSIYFLHQNNIYKIHSTKG